MNIFFRELKANLKSLLIWCVILILLIVIGVAKFSAYYNNPSSLEILNSFPKAVLDAMSLRAFNLTTLTGFYGIMFIYFGLMGGIAAAMWGSDMISKEERDKTVEFSPGAAGFTQPGRHRQSPGGRGQLHRLCAGHLGNVRCRSADLQTRSRPFISFLALEMEAMFVIELIFLAIGLLLGCAMKQYKRSGSIAVAIILVTYFLSVISGMQANLDFLKYFTPFKYFDAAQMLNTGRMDVPFLLLSAAIIVVCMAAAYWAYNKRDLYI